MGLIVENLSQIALCLELLQAVKSIFTALDYRPDECICIKLDVISYTHESLRTRLLPRTGLVCTRIASSAMLLHVLSHC